MRLLAKLLLLIHFCNAYKILVVNPKFAYSHVNYMGNIADALVDAGHDVLIPTIRELVTFSVRTILGDKQVLQQLKSENFNVGIAELFDFSGLAVFEAIGLKNVVGAHTVSSLMEGSAYAVGVPVIPSYVPASQGVTDDSTSFSTRVKNIIYSYLSYYFQLNAARAAEKVMVEKLGKSITPIWDTVSNMTWMLTNTEPMLEFAKPTLHKIVDIGGITVRRPKPLEKVTLQPVIAEDVDNGTTKSHVIQRDVDDTIKSELSNLKRNREVQNKGWTGTMRASDVVKMLPPWARWINASVTTLLKDKKLMESLKAENFDVGIAELFDFIGIAVFEAINLKNIIGTHSYASLVEGTAYAIGVPIIPSFIPATQGVTDDSASFSTRVTNLVFTFYCWYYQKGLANAAESAMMKELGESATPIWDSVSNMSYILTNSIPYFDFAKPSLHNIVEIGGIGIKEPRALGKGWDRVLGLRSQTVLISFGTLANSSCMPDQMKKAIVEVAESFSSVTFIWKYEDSDNAQFASGVKNLYLAKWTPQSDLLSDDRLSLFVTHGGAGSLTEGAFLGTPLVVVPLFADQARNAMLAVKFGFGLMLDKEKLFDSKALGGAIGEVLREPK
ncbi:unnamed protein product [Cylicocyclus nassatus]|uniref:glucuronosyltransferase n=1 Tax=Cylicocyclus nassatus TaxID=53992 RepID=A0AA36H476_CYLNA|nr:unnamed protein product [Cylicocyclus nassatus]